MNTQIPVLAFRNVGQLIQDCEATLFFREETIGRAHEAFEKCLSSSLALMTRTTAVGSSRYNCSLLGHIIAFTRLTCRYADIYTGLLHMLSWWFSKHCRSRVLNDHDGLN